jgi:hypothetical protein
MTEAVNVFLVIRPGVSTSVDPPLGERHVRLKIN